MTDYPDLNKPSGVVTVPYTSTSKPYKVILPNGEELELGSDVIPSKPKVGNWYEVEGRDYVVKKSVQVGKITKLYLAED